MPAGPIRFPSARYLAVAAAGAVVVALVWLAAAQGPKPAAANVRSLGPTIEQVRELAELIVLRVQIADVLYNNDETGARMALLVRGDCDLVIDLDRAAIIEKDEVGHVATLRFPHPRAVRPRVDHERTRVYKVERTTWIPWKDPRDRLYEEGMKQAQKLIEFASATEDEMARARRHAELIIQKFYRQFGWDVRVEWE
ncbi:MAG TPA: DUF4230 domain-containing protein [Phycisphaerae bacterium]|nr:DUF4230 domain-containing protein [Phycisphaerae bacterium]HNU46802.1 DUF4230 domain-containing protein [Phycisphaerae bacterium]